MTILNETYSLSNGIEIPKLGLGTWFIDDDSRAAWRASASATTCSVATSATR